MRAITINPQHDVETFQLDIFDNRETHRVGDIANVANIPLVDPHDRMPVEAPVHPLPYPAPHMTGHLKAALILDNDLQSFCLIMWQRI